MYGLASMLLRGLGNQRDLAQSQVGTSIRLQVIVWANHHQDHTLVWS